LLSCWRSWAASSMALRCRSRKSTRYQCLFEQQGWQQEQWCCSCSRLLLLQLRYRQTAAGGQQNQQPLQECAGNSQVDVDTHASNIQLEESSLRPRLAVAACQQLRWPCQFCWFWRIISVARCMPVHGVLLLQQRLQTDEHLLHNDTFCRSRS
jgi:hypothetical protein